MYLSKALRLCVVVIFHLSVVSVDGVLSVQPGDKENVMQAVTLANENKCNRLCLYRKLCSSYSFRVGGGEGGTLNPPSDPNCILHAACTGTASGCDGTPATGWIEKPVSNSSVKNACSRRPCSETEVCVPATSTSESYACLPLPSDCGVPVVSNGTITGNGTSQNDVAHVTCDEQFVEVPKGVSDEITCLVTSRWTAFQGECQQYEFVPSNGSINFTLPWKLEETGGMMCVRGVYFRAGYQLILNFYQPSTIFLHVVFRYNKTDSDSNSDGIYWTFKVDRDYLGEHAVDRQLLLQPVTNFTLDIQLLADRLLLKLNDSYPYNITWDDETKVKGKVNLLQTEKLGVFGAGMATYVNLHEGC